MADFKKHSTRSHALLSASGANRWMNCTPSARLEERFGEKMTSSYASEGTLAHEIAELYLRRDLLHTIDDQKFATELGKLMVNELYNEEMLDVLPVYTFYCKDRYELAKETNDSVVVETEQRLDLTAYVPDSFGTADCVIISNGVLEVIDLKYGKGVPVYAEWNNQLLLYGLGALQKYDMSYNIERVRMTIVQPRLDNISSWDVCVADVRNWADEVLVPRAKMAYRGVGDLKCGDWCKFCSVKHRCRQLYEEQIEVAKYEFKHPELLTDDEISDVILRSSMFTEWINSVIEYAQNLAVNESHAWPGLKLVEGMSRRKWLSEESATRRLLERCPEYSTDEICTTKLKSITELEKLLGKKRFNEVMSGEIVKPQGSPKLVPESDKRPAIGVSQAQIDFK